MRRAPERNRLTHPHGWRDAPRAGLAVTRPEGAIVPGNRRVELQLMPLLLEGRRMKKDVQCPRSQLVPLAGASCLGGTMFAKLPHAMQMVDAACWQRTL